MAYVADSITNPHVEEKQDIVREVGQYAVWSLSSCKHGFGVDQLRDPCLDTYWQSDGQLPHLVNIQFTKKTTIDCVYIYSDFKLDESYTPNKLSIRAGNSFNDLQEVEFSSLFEPGGWLKILLRDNDKQPIRTFMLQIAIISNHQNGRDTHLRHIRIHSPKTNPENLMGNFSTLLFMQHTCVR